MASQRGRSTVGTAVAATAIAGVVGLIPACSDSPAAPRPNDVPVTPTGVATDVDVCALVPRQAAEQLLDTPLRQVGAGFLPPLLPTFRCEYGERFAEPLVAVQLTVGPVARNVFDRAYGNPAGGDPTLVRQLGDWAYRRQENAQVSLSVFVHGSVVTLEIASDPAQPLDYNSVVTLARSVVDGLPDNPKLAAHQGGDGCRAVDVDAIDAAVAGRPTLSSGFRAVDGSLMCSWASQPGAVTATVFQDTAAVRERRVELEPSEYMNVAGVKLQGAPLEAWSHAERPGDLLIFANAATMVEIKMVPTAGFADDEQVTTDAEVALANAVLRALQPPGAS